MKIPTTIITGFLGAGKTTLIRHIMENIGDKQIALIINEFGDVGVDGELLKGCGDENCTDNDIVELANGCICCTVADEFIPVMEKLLQREKLPSHIIIETSGLALPQPLVKAFNWPQISTKLTIDGVVSLVDGAALSEGRFAADEKALNKQREQDEMLDHETPLGELFEDQIICADLIVINKIDLISDEDLKKIKAQLQKHIRKGVKMIEAAKGEIDIDVLLGLNLNVQDNYEGRQSHHEKYHQNQQHHEHNHDDFISFSLQLPPSENKQELLGKIETIIKNHDILRLKGFAALKDNPSRLIVQAVGTRINAYFDRAWQRGEKQQTSLVIIGQKGLNEQKIRNDLS